MLQKNTFITVNQLTACRFSSNNLLVMLGKSFWEQMISKFHFEIEMRPQK